MTKINKILFAGFLLILFVSPMIVQSARLDYPKNDRLCEHGFLAPTIPIWFCSIQGVTPYTMEASFFDHTTMRDYYRPYREILVTGEVTTTFTSRPIKDSKTMEIIKKEYFNLVIEPDYLYVKGN